MRDMYIIMKDWQEKSPEERFELVRRDVIRRIISRPNSEGHQWPSFFDNKFRRSSRRNRRGNGHKRV